MGDINILSNSGHVGYGIKEFAVDTPEDIDKLPVDAKPGSAAFVISTGSVYMLNSKGEWVEV